MNNLWLNIKNKLPHKNEIMLALKSLSKRDYFIFAASFIALAITALIIIQKINNKFLIEIPAWGGDITEGIIGTPRFINPLLQFSDADKDLTSIIYSGLMRRKSDGNLAEDLAKSYEISKDGLIYTFTLKDNLLFHDKKPLTVDDVIFTIESAKDNLIKSPKKANWDSVAVEAIGSNKIKFTLKQPYSSFLENTTLGILPAHLWKKIPPTQWNLSDLNILAVGSGPYKIDSIRKKSGIPQSYGLVSFKKFYDGKPFIKKITFKFYSNEEELVKAFNRGNVDQINSISPQNALELQNNGYKIYTSTLPRIFGLFFNQNEAPIFTDRAVIKAFEKAIDKKRIIKEVLYGYGQTTDSPLPPSLIEYDNFSSTEKIENMSSREEAAKILDDAGWKVDEDGIRTKEKLSSIEKKISGKKTTKVQNKEITKLAFSISTSDIPELKHTAELIQEDLKAIGAQVELKIFETGNLNQNIIRPRKYDVLLFGQIVNHEGDLFAFWHSSQRNDPGLNIAIYTNPKVDKILESILTTLDRKERTKKYLEFQEEIKKDAPVIFLYSPEFIYVSRKPVKDIIISHLKSAQDRLLNIKNWYLKTDHIWKIFSKK